MKNKVQNYIIKNSLFSKKDKLILAISGGADSVCLMHLLLDLDYKFELAHCNFSLRGNESDKDEDFVKALAKKHHLKLHIKCFDTQKYSDENKISIQMAARELRYSWFYNLLVSERAKYIVIAHHASDNIETFFINLIRGSGLKGLLGIKAKRDSIVRPLLGISRSHIERYLKMRNIPFRKDSSNTSLKYLRNKIRHQLIPLITQMNPNIQKIMLDEIKVLEGVAEVYYKQMESVRERMIQNKEGVIQFKISDLLALRPLNSYLYELLSVYGFSDIQKISEALQGNSGKQFFSNNYQLIIDREYIFITEIDLNNNEQIIIEENDNCIENPIRLNFSISDNVIWKDDLYSAEFDFEKLQFPLILRKWRDGDCFIPLGMKAFKKLSDYFIDNKFSIIEKNKQWLLCSGKDIIWVIGHRIDNRYKLQSKTKKVYIAKLLD